MKTRSGNTWSPTAKRRGKVSFFWGDNGRRRRTVKVCRLGRKRERDVELFRKIKGIHGGKEGAGKGNESEGRYDIKTNSEMLTTVKQNIFQERSTLYRPKKILHVRVPPRMVKGGGWRKR